MRAILLLGLIAGVAQASKGGKTGASGRNKDCNECHTGGETPTVTLTGPSTLAANGAASYRLTVEGGAAMVGGIDVALDNKQGGLAVMRPGTHVVDGELTHLLPLDFEGGKL